MYSSITYADISNKIGVSILGGAVGINNAINGIADANRRKLPVVIISGYVNRWQIGKGAIQELNTEDIVKPITKYSKTVVEADEVMQTLHKALEIALISPCGPVHISIPIDVQMLDVDIKLPELIDKQEIINKCNKNYEYENIYSVARLIDSSKNGIIFVGRGCKSTAKEVMELSEKLEWHIITTPEGKGVISTDFEYNLGSYGFNGTDLATDYVENSGADCILILGTTLGEGATRNYNNVLVKGRKIIHVDLDRSELNKVLKADVAIYNSLENVLPRLIDACKKQQHEKIDNLILNKPYVCNHTGLSTRLVLEKIPSIMPEEYYMVIDIGEFMNFVFKYLPIPKNTGYTLSLNYGAMGTGISGAVGAALANRDKVTGVIVGDGSFFMNGMEILTARENKLKIVHFVINNSMLGYVEHGHQYLFGRQLHGLIQKRVSIKAVVNAMGIPALQIYDLGDLDVCKNCIKYMKGPLVIELITDGTELPAVADRFKALNNEK